MVCPGFSIGIIRHHALVTDPGLFFIPIRLHSYNFVAFVRVPTQVGVPRRTATADTNLCRNRIPSTIPFPRQAPDLTRHYVPLRSMLKCENNMVCWCSVVLRKDRGNHTVSPQSPFACAGPDLGSGTPGTTHSHVTGPQAVPQCSLQEQAFCTCDSNFPQVLPCALLRLLLVARVPSGCYL